MNINILILVSFIFIFFSSAQNFKLSSESFHLAKRRAIATAKRKCKNNFVYNPVNTNFLNSETSYGNTLETLLTNTFEIVLINL